MYRPTLTFCCACLALAMSGEIHPVAAQPKPAASKAVPINASLAGVDRLYEDLDYIFGLAGESQAATELKDTLGVFFEGVDPKTAAVFQVYVRKGKFNTVMHVPTKGSPSDFRNNIKALGVKNRFLGGGLYQLSGLFTGFLKEGGGVSVIAEDRADTTTLTGGLATYKLKLDPDNRDFVASVINDAAQITDRAAAIEEVRKQVMPGLKKLKNESDDQFALRKLTLEQELTEIKQIYSEAASIHTVVDLVPANKTSQSVTELDALPDTELAKVIDGLAAEPSYFAGVPLDATAPLCAMINLKVDAMRQAHVKNFLKQSRPMLLSQIKEAETASDKTKEYTLITTEIIYDVVEKSADAGLFDSFLNVTKSDGGAHTMVGGARVDGAIVKAGLDRLKATAPVELDVATVGEVSLHKVTLPTDLTELQAIYGKDLVLFVGTSPQAVWYAMGQDAEVKLKDAIGKIGQPAANPANAVVQLNGNALIWYELFDAHRTKNKKGNAEDRKTAIDALKKGGDQFEFKMEKLEKKLKLSLILHEGVLRYMGKVGAKFVRENLQN